MEGAGDEAAPPLAPTVQGGPSIFARAAGKIDEAVMRMIEKDDAFEGLSKKKAHKMVMVGSFFFSKLAFAAALVYFTYTGIMTDQKAKFMALDLTAGKCKQIPIALSGKYLLDQNGSWTGTANYEAGRARVKLQLNSFQHSQDEYASFMQDVQTIVQGVAVKSPNNNLAVNLLYWASFGYKYIDGNNVHYIRFTGDLQSILDREYMHGVFADVSGDCDAESQVLWDPNSGRMGLKMSFAEVKASAKCTEAMDPASLGYNAEINGDDFTIRFDTRSSATAFAVNWDILPTDLLDGVFDPTFDGKTIGCNPALNTPNCGNDTYAFFMGMDPDLVGMAPIYCLKPLTRSMPASSYFFTNLCAIRVANQYVYPFFQHMGISGVNGNNPYEPKPCNCTSPDGRDPYCDDFDLNIGFVFFEVARNDTMLNWQYLLDMVYRNDNVDLNEQIYHAAFAAQRTGGVALKYPPIQPATLDPADVTAALAKLQSPEWRQETYAFCQQNCTVFSFRLFDNLNRFINGDSYNLAAGGCSDTFYDTSYPYDVAALLPPAPLVQDYTQCVNFLLTSVTQSFGVAMGTAAPITAAFVLLMCLTVGWVWEKFFAPKEVEVAVAEGAVMVEGDEPKEDAYPGGPPDMAGLPGRRGNASAFSRRAGAAGSRRPLDGFSSSDESGGYNGFDSGSDSESGTGAVQLRPRRRRPPRAAGAEGGGEYKDGSNPFVSGLELINPVQYLFPATAAPKQQPPPPARKAVRRPKTQV